MHSAFDSWLHLISAFIAILDEFFLLFQSIQISFAAYIVGKSQ